MELSKLLIEPKNVLRGEDLAILTDIRESHPYENGKANPNIVDGYKLNCVCPSNGFERITVHVQDKPAITKETLDNAETPVKVRFESPDFKIYRDYRNNTYALSCKAKSVTIVK